MSKVRIHLTQKKGKETVEEFVNTRNHLTPNIKKLFDRPQKKKGKKKLFDHCYEYFSD